MPGTNRTLLLAAFFLSSFALMLCSEGWVGAAPVPKESPKVKPIYTPPGDGTGMCNRCNFCTYMMHFLEEDVPVGGGVVVPEFYTYVLRAGMTSTNVYNALTPYNARPIITPNGYNFVDPNMECLEDNLTDVILGGTESLRVFECGLPAEIQKACTPAGNALPPAGNLRRWQLLSNGATNGLGAVYGRFKCPSATKTY